MRHGGTTALLGALALALTATACTDDPAPKRSTKAVVEVDEPSALVDEPVRIRITGLHAGEKVKVTSEAASYDGNTWSGEASFTADGEGTVDLTRARPRSGTYQTVDGMGLFWSMVPPEGADPDTTSFGTAPPERQPSYSVRIAVEAGGRGVGDRRLTRTFLAEGVTSTRLDLAEDEISGRLLTPAKGTPRRAPVLLFGGSEGGAFAREDAALLASRGHPTLLLCYYRCPGLPSTLREVPLEYFAKAARHLARQSGPGAGRMAAIGTSRGSEPAQLLAQHYPELIRDAVVFAPSNEVVGSFPPGGAAWTKNGRAIPEGPIASDRVRGAVLAIAGGEDALWDARKGAEAIAARKGTAQPHRALVYPGAGHLVGSFPHLPTGISPVHPVLRKPLPMGGSREEDAAARADAWPKVLAFLDR